MSDPREDQGVSYPRQEALTRRFRLGLPRSFSVSRDGRQVLFIRSSSGRDAAGCLWLIDSSGNERLVVDSRQLLTDDADLPAAERARRERLREVTSGITAYTVDRGFERVAFCIDGSPFTVDVAAGAPPVALPSPGPVVDPRISPDGAHVAFVHDGALYVTAADGSGEASCLARPQSPTQTWGLADFVAAEELERHRGLWWLPDSSALLAEFVDEASVALQWISDPANPTNEPREHRYPSAGTTNPVARLFRIDLDAVHDEVVWDREEYPYLATVDPSHADITVVSVLSRDQTRQLILSVPHASATASELAVRTTTPWITIASGVPSLDDAGALLEIVADVETDTFRLTRDDEPITPAGVQVTGVVLTQPDAIIVTAVTEPTTQHLLRVDIDGTCTWLTDGPRLVSAVGHSTEALVTVTMSDEFSGPSVEFTSHGSSTSIASAAETPVVIPDIRFHSEGEIDFAVLLPSGHVSGTPLPVIMAPYAGPHHSRVVRARNSFASDQWLADQGFAVVVVDGRGTPCRGPRREFAVHHDLAAGVLQDQVDGLAAAARLYPDLDLTRVGITGWSFGGYLAALAVLDRPDVFHAAVAGAPVTEWRLYDTAYTERYLGTPQDNPEVYDANSLLTRASRLTRPLLLIHGLADDNVVAAHTLRMSSALLAAGCAHNVLPLSGVTHMTPQEIVAENLLLLEVDFLRTHLHPRG